MKLSSNHDTYQLRLGTNIGQKAINALKYIGEVSNFLVSYQIRFRVGKSVPIKNWQGNRFGGETDGEVADGVCI